MLIRCQLLSIALNQKNVNIRLPSSLLMISFDREAAIRCPSTQLNYQSFIFLSKKMLITNFIKFRTNVILFLIIFWNRENVTLQPKTN